MPSRKDVPVASVSWDAASRIAALPPRCRDVLNGIIAGYSSKMIAYELGISPRTVELYRANLKRQLGARNMADAIRMAYEARAICDLLQRSGELQRPDGEVMGDFDKSSPEQGDLFPVPRGGRFRTGQA